MFEMGSFRRPILFGPNQGGYGGGQAGGKDGLGGGRDTGNGGGGKSSADQRHANRRAEIERVGKLAGQSTQADNSGTSPAGRTASALQGMARDFRNVGNTDVENFGNMVARAFGFNEQRPSIARAKERSTATPPGSVTDRRAGWGFDPAVMAGDLLGGAAGLPFGGGLIADQISAALGRPAEISLGPSVFGGAAPTGPTGVNTASGVNPAGGSGMPTGGGTGNGGQMAPNPAAPSGPIAAPGQMAPKPVNPAAPPSMPAPITGTPYAQALPMPGQVRLPPNYFMSQMT